jgi:16S rRNA (adenine1518-N6/adenine1519-N6)-dimethyltransferase
VGERIAKSKKESILSLSVKAYGTPRYMGSVPRGAFSPPPSVDSAILQITDISRTQFKDSTHEETFFALLHAGFGQKRKLLRRNIASLFTEDVVERMKKAHIPLDARAEDVPLSSWLLLAEK